MKKQIIFAVGALASLLLSACTTRLTDFTIISTKNIELSKLSEYKRGEKRVQGEDKISIIVFIPTGQPDMKEAIDRAIESVPGAAALLDGVLYHNFWWIPYIYGEAAYVVEGTPLLEPSRRTGDR